jgi:hypothetical protein
MAFNLQHNEKLYLISTKAQWLLHVPPALIIDNFAFCPQCVSYECQSKNDYFPKRH